MVGTGQIPSSPPTTILRGFTSVIMWGCGVTGDEALKVCCAGEELWEWMRTLLRREKVVKEGESC
jgi:hypothetical protein